ncbi:DMT family transporter [Mesobacterium pallidum]|uniref:DMT family transporter n=1 Tax=Mesobacterium pallidum TaxID=2872037 RepID=UPI001EE3641A|nr:DMT family transporter [Mesobacterium pallidum]
MAVSDNIRGAGFMVGAMCLFAVEDALFKSVAGTAAGLSPGLATICFGLTALVLSCAYARGVGDPLWTRAYLGPRLLLRTAFEIMGRLFFALALAFTPLGTTSAILQATPLVVTAAAALFLRETVGPRRWLAMIVGFLGVLMILRPTPEAFRADALLAVAGMIGFAGRDLMTRAAPPEVTPRQLAILGFAVVTVAGLLIWSFETAPTRLPHPGEAARLLATGAVGLLAYTALTRAMRTGEVAVVTPFRYSRLLVALVFAVVLFGERPDGWTLAGAALIVASGLYTLMRSAARDKSGQRGQTAL